jgi:hypothetical protein
MMLCMHHYSFFYKSRKRSLFSLRTTNIYSLSLVLCVCSTATLTAPTSLLRDTFFGGSTQFASLLWVHVALVPPYVPAVSVWLVGGLIRVMNSLFLFILMGQVSS